jgi:hypothetical protein
MLEQEKASGLVLVKDWQLVKEKAWERVKE